MNEAKDQQAVLKSVLHYFYQDNTRSGAHCKHNLKYHLVWTPKYRKALLVGKLAIRLDQIFHQIAQEYDLLIIASEVMPDHIHLLVEAPPKYSPTQLVQYFKGISSKLIRQEFLNEIKPYVWKDNTFWAKGYYVASVSDSITTQVIRDYINSQKVNEKKFKKAPTSDFHQLKLLPD